MMRSISPDQLATIKSQQSGNVAVHQITGGHKTFHQKSNQQLQKNSKNQPLNTSLLKFPQQTNGSQRVIMNQDQGSIKRSISSSDITKSNNMPIKLEQQVLIDQLKAKNAELMGLLCDKQQQDKQRSIDSQDELLHTQRLSNQASNLLSSMGCCSPSKEWLHLSTYKDLILSIISQLSKIKTLNSELQLPSIEQHNLIDQQASNLKIDITNLKNNNELLISQIRKLELCLINADKQYQMYQESTHKLIQQITELKAFKKSITQYYTSQNIQSWKSTAITDPQTVSDSRNQNQHLLRSNYEEPSPSFLKIMATEQIIEQDIEYNLAQINSPVKEFSQQQFTNGFCVKSPSPMKIPTVQLKNSRSQNSGFENSSSWLSKSIPSNFVLPDISSQNDYTPVKKADLGMLNINQKVQKLIRQYQKIQMYQPFPQQIAKSRVKKFDQFNNNQVNATQEEMSFLNGGSSTDRPQGRRDITRFQNNSPQILSDRYKIMKQSD